MFREGCVWILSLVQDKYLIFPHYEYNICVRGIRLGGLGRSRCSQLVLSCTTTEDHLFEYKLQRTQDEEDEEGELIRLVLEVYKKMYI